MTPEQQRIAIATACGWTDIAPCSCGEKTPRGWHKDYPNGTKHLPHYPADLNATHKAENYLINTPKLEEDYYLALKRNFRATAAERCEAILKVIGKWLLCGKEEV